jgi:nitrile hydratase accessory protein
MNAASSKEKIGRLNIGIAAPPSLCDHLQFDEPWQGRIFGLALALSEAGNYPWESFRQNLIRAIGQWERSHTLNDPEWRYYEQWLTAFENLVLELDIVKPEELDERTEAFRLRQRDEVI